VITKKSVVFALIPTLFFVWTVLCGQVFAQTRARTDSGTEVILYPDGTWKYATGLAVRSSPTVKYSKPISSKTFLKTERGDFGVWYNGSKWKKSAKTDVEGKVNFNLVGEDGYAMVIPEGMEIPTGSLKEAALENAREAGAEVKVSLEEMRVVNGREILCLKLEGTVKQIPFVYYGYYYGGEEGAIQVVTYTGSIYRFP
jgi:hypothetical protein